MLLDHLRQVVGLRGYAQRDPLNEFKTEAFSLFEHLLQRLRTEVTRTLMNIPIQVVSGDPGPDGPAGGVPVGGPSFAQRPALPQMEMHKFDPDTGRDEMGPDDPGGAMPRSSRPSAMVDPRNAATWGKTPRNAPCPCGSGKKYKHCHGTVGAEA